MTIGYNEVEEGTIPLHQMNPRNRATSQRGQHPGGRRSFDEIFFRSCAEIVVSLDINHRLACRKPQAGPPHRQTRPIRPDDSLCHNRLDGASVHPRLMEAQRRQPPPHPEACDRHLRLLNRYKSLTIKNQKLQL